MSDEIFLDGKTYLSSKRAAKETGYVQDYIGQLARKGLIDAQRIGGLWYIFPASLEAYKRNAEAFTPQPPTQQAPQGADTIVSFDGKDYITAAKAAKMTGYNPDYVGQLARGGKILSRQVGNRWYVEREGLLAHKAEKDRLLAAVQAESAGLVRPQPVQPHTQQSSQGHPLGAPAPVHSSTLSPIQPTSIPTKPQIPKAAEYVYDESAQLRYIREEDALFPSLERTPSAVEARKEEMRDESPQDSHQEAHEIPIRVLRHDLAKMKPTSAYVPARKQEARRPSSKSLGRTVKAVAALTVVIVLSYGFVSVKSEGTYAAFVPKGASASYDTMAASVGVAIEKVGSIVESWVSEEVEYFRSE